MFYVFLWTMVNSQFCGEFCVPVSERHVLDVSISKHCFGKNIIVFHGGWGPIDNDLDPISNKFRVIYFHQRGWGKSIPTGDTNENLVNDTISDVEKIRKFADVARWYAVIGGSNGAMIALRYAVAFPNVVDRVILRGYWSLTPHQLAWNYFGLGKRTFFPMKWRSFCDIVNCNGADVIMKYKEQLRDNVTIAKAWLKWDGLGASIRKNNGLSKRQWYENNFVAAVRLGIHLYLQPHFLPDITSLKCVYFLVGKFDFLCPPSFSEEVILDDLRHHFVIVEDAGHTTNDIVKDVNWIEKALSQEYCSPISSM